MSSAEADALARALGVEPSELSFLDGIPPADLHQLRSQIRDALFAQDRHHFTRLAALAAAVPAQIAARITQLAIPPLLAAFTAQVLDPGKAGAMVARLPVPYLADVALAIDADRAAAIVGDIPAAPVAAVAAELARRGEWVVIGGFVAHVSGEALAASVAGFDGAQLLHLSYHLDDRDRVEEITAQLSEAQLDDMIAAAGREALWVELAGVFALSSADQLSRLRARFAAAPTAVRGAAPPGVLEWAVA